MHLVYRVRHHLGLKVTQDGSGAYHRPEAYSIITACCCQTRLIRTR